MIQSEPEERSSDDDEEIRNEPGKRASEDENDEDAQRSFAGYYGAAIGVWTGVFGVLTGIGLLLLPKDTPTELLLILSACAALSTGSVVGFRAWKSAARFAASAISAGMAIICLAALSMAANDAPRISPAATDTAGPTPPPAAASQSSPAASASASGSSSPATAGPPLGGSPEYLADMSYQVATGTNSPQTNTTDTPWSLGGTPYPNSIGYAGDVSTDSVNYTIKGSPYGWFDATVGVNDNAAVSDQGIQVQFTVIVNPGNRQYTETVQWDQPATFHVNIRGAAMLTLETNTFFNDINLSSSSYAVWGNARLAPGS
jgi:NPCBM/NEW2 domain